MQFRHTKFHLYCTTAAMRTSKSPYIAFTCFHVTYSERGNYEITVENCSYMGGDVK